MIFASNFHKNTFFLKFFLKRFSKSKICAQFGSIIYAAHVLENSLRRRRFYWQKPYIIKRESFAPSLFVFDRSRPRRRCYCSFADLVHLLSHALRRVLSHALGRVCIDSLCKFRRCVSEIRLHGFRIIAVVKCHRAVCMPQCVDRHVGNAEPLDDTLKVRINCLAREVSSRGIWKHEVFVFPCFSFVFLNKAKCLSSDFSAF